jgi:regulator of protease activity HflC (stomatin/prohibitin superfamily)
MMSSIKSFLGKFIRRNVVSLIVGALGIFFFLTLFSDRIFISIPAGHAGVLWQRFSGGTDVNGKYDEGFHVIYPWNRMTIYNVRLNEASNTITVLARDGLAIKVEFLVRYRPRAKTLGFLHKHMGKEYLKVLIMPEINSQSRKTMAKYSPEEIYSTKRGHIEADIQKVVMKELEVSFSLKEVVEGTADKKQTAFWENQKKSLVFVEDILLKTITLPETIRVAIEAKVEHKHRMLQYKYILDREVEESKRKEIEALGISRFQQIVKNGISDRYLRWKGIDATLELAKSNNSKVVIIGAGKEGMPLILGNMNAQPTIASPSEKVSSGTLDAPLSGDNARTTAKAPANTTVEEKSLATKAAEILKTPIGDIMKTAPTEPGKDAKAKP